MTFTLGDIGVLVAVFATSFTCIFFIFNWIFFKPTKDNIKSIDGRFEEEKLRAAGKREECGVKFTRLEETPSILNSLKENVLVIKLFLMSKHNDAPNAFSVTNSPRVLNIPGRNLYEKSGARDVLENNIDNYIKKIEEVGPKTALDVEETSLSVLYACSDNEEFIQLKNYVYNNPVFEEQSIGIATICFVMSIPLRDEYLERHTEIIQDNE